MRNHKIIKNYLYNTSYELIRLLAPLVTTPYISRVLGANGVGAYSFTQSIASYFVLLGAAGTTLYGQREIAYVRDKKEECIESFWEIEIIRIITSVICTIIFFISFKDDPTYGALYRFLSLEVLATAFDISWFFMGIENFKVTVIRNTLIRVVGIVLVFLLVKKPEDVSIYTLCVTIPTLIGNISLWLNMRKYLIYPSFEVVKKIPHRIRPIAILFLPQIAVEVYTVLDKTMIGIFGSSIEQVGYYTNAQKIVRIVLMIVTSLGTVMLPAMSASFAHGKREEIMNKLKIAFRFVFLLAFALMFGLMSIAQKFVPIFFGKGYELVGPLIIVISPIVVVIGISNVIGKQYLLPTKQQSAYTVSIIIGAVVNFLLNIFLIPLYDAIGASIATVIAEIAVTVVQIWFVRNQLLLGDCFKPIFKYMILGGVMFAVVWGISRVVPDGVISIAILIIIGIIVYMLGLLTTKDEMIKLGIRIFKYNK